MTTAPDLAPTILELAGLGEMPSTMTGEPFGDVLAGRTGGAQTLCGELVAAVPGGG